MEIIPLFDPKKHEKKEKVREQLKRERAKGRIALFPEIEEDEIDDGSWLPQDACGGHQWNARIGKWQISSVCGSDYDHQK